MAVDEGLNEVEKKAIENCERREYWCPVGMHFHTVFVSPETSMPETYTDMACGNHQPDEE